MFNIRFWIIAICVLNVQVYAQHNQSVPNILLLSEEFFNVTRLTCIASTNALNSALVFNSILDLKTPAVYKPVHNYYAKIINCNFEKLTTCHEAYRSNLILTESGTHLIAPVLDERWESFSLNKKNKIEIQNNLGLSIKMKKNMKIMICDDKICRVINVLNSIAEQATKWKHLTVLVSPTNNSVTIMGDKLRTYSINNTDNIYIKSSTEMTWKNHTYKYATLNVSSAIKQIGPEFEARATYKLCISMYVVTCSRCIFQLQLVNETNHTVSNIVKIQGSVRNNMVSWEKIRLTAKLTDGIKYRLVASNMNEFLIIQRHIEPSFWAIDDIRQCHYDEIRISTLYSTDPNVSCEALKYPDWNVKQNYQNRTKAVFNCMDSRYIGPYCNISCQTVLQSEHCDRNVLCQPSRANENGICGCTEKYYGPNCNEDCNTGHVVHKCKKLDQHGNTINSQNSYECNESEKMCSIDFLETDYQQYLPLLSLLAVPVIAFLLYWFVVKKRCDPHYIEVAPRLRSYIEILNVPAAGSVSNNPMVEDDGLPIYEHIESNIKITKLTPNNYAIYSNTTMESECVNITHNNDENIYANLENSTTMIKAYDLEMYVRKALKNQEFDEQYSSVPQHQMKPCTYGTIEANIYKNQYKNVLPYDDNRVELEKINGDPYSDYINASYIEGYKSKKDYIVTQHPKQQTINDFWRMIWQENVTDIIMLTNTNDNNKIIRLDEGNGNYSLNRLDVRKQQSLVNYWPKLHNTEEYGKIKVWHIYTESYVSYEIRAFEVSIGTERKQIRQLAFISWPDYEIPDHPQYFTEFAKEVSEISLNNAPIVVHCSAGIGRSGVLILCDICIRMMNEEGGIDVLKYLQKIQTQRNRIINNTVFYKLVYLTLLDYLLAPTTEFENDFHEYVNNMLNKNKLQEQMEYLEKITFFENALVKKIKYKSDFTKNRLSDIIPEYDCIQLADNQSKNKDTYDINAVPVDGYKKSNQFIVTQFPLPNTLSDFWRMIFKKHVKVIVSLNDVPVNDKTCCEFWPTNNEEFQPIQSLSIEHVKTEHYEFHSVFTLVFKTLYVTDNVEDRTVYVIQLNGWAFNQPTPERVFHLLRILGEVESLWKRKLPIAVTCFNGVTAAGLFVALTYLMDQLTKEDICNVYEAVRVIRKNRKQFITNKEQLEFLYEGVLYFSNSMQKQQIYENVGTIKSKTYINK